MTIHEAIHMPTEFINNAVGTALANQHLLLNQSVKSKGGISRPSSGSGSCLDLMPSFKRLIPKVKERDYSLNVMNS
jgi:hypothetical protein